MPLTLEFVVECFRGARYSITKHGYEELDNDGITIAVLEAAVAGDSPEIIERKPDDPRGPTCLILGWCEPDLPIHVWVGMSDEQAEIITAYRPSSLRFYPPEFRKRR